METKPVKRIKLSSDVMEINDQNESSLSYDDLPEEMQEKIFSYLDLRNLCQAGKVCKKWYHITRSPVFWRRVDTQSQHLTYNEIKKFIEILPSCVTHLRLYVGRRKLGTLCFSELTVTLRERCPNLQVLIFVDVRLRYTRIGDICISRAFKKFPRNLRVLSFQHSIFNSFFYVREDSSFRLSKIEVLDVSHSYEMGKTVLTIASKLPHLKKLFLSGCMVVDEDIHRCYGIFSSLQVLDLEGTIIGGEAFEVILTFGQNLIELYVCHTVIEDKDLTFGNHKALAQLEIICLRETDVTHQGIRTLIRSCQSLTHVYTNHSSVADELRKVSDKCKPKKVHYDNSHKYCDHFRKIDYLNDY